MQCEEAEAAQRRAGTWERGQYYAPVCGEGTTWDTNICVNTIGSFQCSCRDGYTTDGPGTPCRDSDECAICKGDDTSKCPCDKPWHCTDLVGIRTELMKEVPCFCRAGQLGQGSNVVVADHYRLRFTWAGTGWDDRECVEVDTCASNPCGRNTKPCESLRFQTLPDLTIDERRVIGDDAPDRPALNINYVEGSLRDDLYWQLRGYRCECLDGYTRRSVFQPCEAVCTPACDRGTCERDPSGQANRCVCDPGYTGVTCSTFSGADDRAVFAEQVGRALVRTEEFLSQGQCEDSLVAIDGILRSLAALEAAGGTPTNTTIVLLVASIESCLDCFIARIQSGSNVEPVPALSLFFVSEYVLETNVKYAALFRAGDEALGVLRSIQKV